MKRTIKIDNIYTDWFPIVSGIRQGDVVVPTMFNYYVDDLPFKIKDLDLGIPFTYNKTIALMFADDTVLPANTPYDLQTMINKVSDWCEC